MIIDAVMFFNELKVLELRLHELDSVVDKFVIVEALEVHGSPAKKTANLANDWDIVKPFAHKIEYNVLSKLEPPYQNDRDGWPREHFNRNALLTSVLKVSKDLSDLVIISDVDEIPRASAVSKLRPSPNLKALQLDLFYYNVNNYCSPWNGPVVGTIGQLKEQAPQGFRDRRDSIDRIADAGWHFSYFGGPARILHKAACFAHADDDMVRDLRNRSVGELKFDITSRRDLYRRSSVSNPRRESNDPRLPQYYLGHLDYFKEFTDGN